MTFKPIVFIAGICMIISAYLLVLFGFDDGLRLWSIGGGLVAGLLGMQLGAVIMKRYA